MQIQDAPLEHGRPVAVEGSLDAAQHTGLAIGPVVVVQSRFR